MAACCCVPVARLLLRGRLPGVMYARLRVKNAPQGLWRSGKSANLETFLQEGVKSAGGRGLVALRAGHPD